MSSNDLWQKLAQQATQQNQPQQPVVQPQTIELLGQPQSISNVMQGIPPLNQPSVFVGSPIIEDEETDLEEEEDDFEDGVDDPNRPQNDFSLESLLGTTPPQPTQNQQGGIVTDIFAMLNNNTPQPVTSVTNANVEVAAKRGRGRPPKQESEKVINQLNQMQINTEQEQFKSPTISSTPSQTIKQNPKDVAIALPKATLREIGEALQRIGAACISVANS